MIQFKLKFLVFLVVSFFGTLQIRAQKQINIQSTAVPFMLISPDARSGGMGNLSLAMSPDANDLFGNTAKLPFMAEQKGFLINYTPWLKELGLTDVYLASAGFYKKMNNISSINTSLRYFSLGNIEFTDEFGNYSTLPSQRPSEFSYDFGYSVLLTDHLSMGVTLRYIHSKLVTGSFINNPAIYKPGNTLSGDISLFYKRNEDLQGLHAGLLLSNLGGKISYTDQDHKYFIPANLGLGIGYLNKFDTENSLEFGVDVNRLLVPVSPGSDPAAMEHYFNQSVVSSWFNSFTAKEGMPLGESIKASTGMEYNYMDRFYLRAGYYLDNNKNLGKMQYFTIGTSFQYQLSKFNISYLVPSGGGITKNPLSNTIRFGSVFYF